MNMLIGARCADNNAEDRTGVGEADVDDLRNLLVVVVDDLIQRGDVEGKLVAVESEEVGGVVAAHVPVGVRDDGEGERHCLSRVRVVGVDVRKQTRVGVSGRERIPMATVIRKMKYTGGCPVCRFLPAHMFDLCFHERGCRPRNRVSRSSSLRSRRRQPTAH
jgi:hypothetical protein